MLQLPLNFQPSDVLAPSAQPLAPDLVFTRHPRARRYVIRITDEGTVRVTVPRWGSKREAAAFAAREHAWIAKQLRMQAERQLKARERRTASDETAVTNAERQAGVVAGQRELIARAKQELPPRLLAGVAEVEPHPPVGMAGDVRRDRQVC